MECNFTDKTIWTGDNLDILRGLNSDCVDLIYLDPPLNSNRDYAAPVGSKAAHTQCRAERGTASGGTLSYMAAGVRQSSPPALPLTGI